jgi:hypothetical protein
MTHDPLCPTYDCLCDEDEDCMECACQCDLIAKVREDAIAGAVQQVEALPPHHGSYAGWLMADEAIAAIKGDHA